MNKILAECIKKLAEIKGRLLDINSDDDRSDGLNCANSLIRQSIDTRISLIKEIYGVPEPGESHTDAEYALYCLEFTESLYEVFKEHFDEAKDTPFDRGYKSQITVFLKMLAPLQEWLKRTSTKTIYES